MKRTQTRQVWLGKVAIGGGAPITIQSMTNTDTRDVAATVAQIRALAEAGCEIVRCTVPDMEAARALKAIRAACPIPLVAGRIRSGSWWPAPRIMGLPSASG